MATAPYSVIHDNVDQKVLKWTLTDANPDGQPWVFAGNFSRISFQVFGNFGAGGTVQAQGTNEKATPANWYNVVDPQGNAISATAAKIEQILESCYQLRPYLSAGTGVTVTVLMFFGV